MAKSIKFKNDTYLDSTSIMHNKKKLSELLAPKKLNIFTVSIGSLSSNSSKDITSNFSKLENDRPILALCYGEDKSWRGYCIFENNFSYAYGYSSNCCSIQKESGKIIIKNTHTSTLNFGTVTVKWFYL